METARPPLSEELWIQAFSFLPIQTVLSGSQVCQKWNRMLHDLKVMVQMLSTKGFQEAAEDLSPLIALEKISWKEIPEMSPLSTLFHKVFESYIASLYSPTGDNPIVPFLKRGDSMFTITDRTDVVWRKKGALIATFKSTEGDLLTHLAHDRHSLFTLSSKGNITHWDLKSKSEVQKLQYPSVKARQFDATDGSIILNQGTRELDIIRYQDLTSSTKQSIDDSYTKFFLQNHNLMICSEKNDPLMVFDLKNNTWKKQIQLETDPSLKINDVAAQEDLILTCDGISTLTLYSSKTGKLIKRQHFNASKSIHHPSVKWTHHIMLKNLFIGYGLVETGKKVVTVVDLNTWKIVGRIEGLFNFDKMILNPEPLAKLVTCCRKNISELAINLEFYDQKD